MMKNNMIKLLTTPTSVYVHECDVGKKIKIDLGTNRSLSEKKKEGKNVAHKRLPSRTSYPEKRSQSYSEEIASRSMAHPGVVGEGCCPGFRKDSTMKQPASSPLRGII
jgi:hypothetical protein